MLDVNLLRANPERVKEGVAAKNFDPAVVDEFLELDAGWRRATAELEKLRASQKEFSRQREVEVAKTNKEKIKIKEKEVLDLEVRRLAAWERIPNLPLAEVPVGRNELENKILRQVGEPRQFDFKPLDHLEIGVKLGIIDFESGAKVAGSGFYYLRNEGVALELALVKYALDFLGEKGFELYLTPEMAREKFYLGTGYQPRGPEAQTYLIENSNLGLIATAEVTLAGIHAGEILEENSLPRWYAGYSHCFRQEAGAYGKYSKGLYRVHQFTKVEMFAYAKPEESPRVHERLLALEEELWQGLGIPYRVVEMCTGDLGAQAARKFDLEAWMPGRGDWGEITSTSNTTDYQARRLGIKVRRSSGELEFVHTLNGTAIATSRAIVAILENYQTADGRVEVPAVLRKYVGQEIIE